MGSSCREGPHQAWLCLTVLEQDKQGRAEDGGQVHRKSGSLGKFVVKKQVKDQTGKSICQSQSGSGPAKRVRQHLVIVGHVHSDKTGPRSSREISSQVRINRASWPGMAVAELETSSPAT